MPKNIDIDNFFKIYYTYINKKGERIMKIKGNCAFYCYGIDGFKKFNNGINNNYNPDLIVMNYGRGKEYVFDKK